MWLEKFNVKIRNKPPHAAAVVGKKNKINI